MDDNLKNYLEVAETAALKAGTILRKYYLNLKHIDKKGEGGNLVTEADKLAEKLIISMIMEKFPDHKIIAEESGKNNVKESDYLWVIDPLDGTTNYSHGYPIYAVSIALLKNNDPIVGVIYIPHMDELYKAEIGKGALLNNKKISVTKVDKLVESLLVTGFSYDRAIIEENNYKEYCQLSNLTHGVRRSGSAAFDLASVAAGRIDGFWETGLSIWDVSAGSIIVREAGGKVTGIDGNEISMKDVGIIATNSKIHDELSDEIRFIKSCVNF